MSSTVEVLYLASGERVVAEIIGESGGDGHPNQIKIRHPQILVMNYQTAQGQFIPFMLESNYSETDRREGIDINASWVCHRGPASEELKNALLELTNPVKGPPKPQVVTPDQMANGGSGLHLAD